MTEPLLFGDCHTHLDQYDASELPDILQRAGDVGVSFVILAGTTLESTRECIGLTSIHDALYAGVGIHPCQAYEPGGPIRAVRGTGVGWPSLRPRWSASARWGWTTCPNRPTTRCRTKCSASTSGWPRACNLPIIFHSRAEGLRGAPANEVHSAVFRVLREEQAGDVGGAMHYFQADEATARAAIDCGFYISLARPLTRLPEVQEAARAIPLENIVLETDAYPQPFKKYRSNWTEPRHVAEVAQCLAEVKGM